MRTDITHNKSYTVDVTIVMDQMNLINILNPECFFLLYYERSNELNDSFGALIKSKSRTHFEVWTKVTSHSWREWLQTPNTKRNRYQAKMSQS